MRSSRVLVAEFGISAALMSWGAIKEGYWPWPPALARIAFAFALLSIVALVEERLAALLGAGFLIAQIVKTPQDADGNFRFVGGVPKDQFWGVLYIGGSPKSRAENKDVPDRVWSPSAVGGGIGRNVPIQEKPDKGGTVFV